MASSQTKTCKKCRESKHRSEFHVRTASLDGLRYWCKVCTNTYDAKRREDPAKRKRKREQQAAQRQTPAGKKARRDSANARRATPRGKLKSQIRCALYNFVIKTQDTRKKQDLFGCTRTQFREHLESQFESWMTWDNYGTNTGQYEKTWQFDHIVPYTAFPTYEDLDEHKHVVCWFRNVQPLCAKKNNEKNDAFTQEERDVLIAWHRQCSSI